MGLDFYDLFYFDTPSYFFNRATKDMYPYKAIEKDGKLFIVTNTLGVSPDDISVEVKLADNRQYQIVSVSGSTKHEILEKEYNVNMNFKVFKDIKEVNWEAKDGLLTLEILFNEPVKPAIKVIRK